MNNSMAQDIQLHQIQIQLQHNILQERQILQCKRKLFLIYQNMLKELSRIFAALMKGTGTKNLSIL